MKNKILKIGMLILSLVILVSVCGFTNPSAVTSMKNVNSGNERDINPPRCSIFVSDKVKIGNTINATISCYDVNGLSDTSISSSDFNIRGGLFLKKIQIVEISRCYTYNNMNYTWYVKLKGKFLGNATISLNGAAITDTSGNGNIDSLDRNIKVTIR